MLYYFNMIIQVAAYILIFWSKHYKYFLTESLFQNYDLSQNENWVQMRYVWVWGCKGGEIGNSSFVSILAFCTKQWIDIFLMINVIHCIIAVLIMSYTQNFTCILCMLGCIVLCVLCMVYKCIWFWS